MSPVYFLMFKDTKLPLQIPRVKRVKFQSKLRKVHGEKKRRGQSGSKSRLHYIYMLNVFELYVVQPKSSRNLNAAA
jgi:hypothetical protein